MRLPKPFKFSATCLHRGPKIITTKAAPIRKWLGGGGKDVKESSYLILSSVYPILSIFTDLITGIPDLLRGVNELKNVNKILTN